MNTRSIAAKGYMAAIVFLGGLMAGSVASSAAGACFVGPAKLSDASINAFLAAPGDLLAGNPAGGIPLATAVRGLAGSSSDALSPLAGLAANATPAQKAAIGAGLARAAKACQVASPEYAQLIQQTVAGMNSPEVLAAYLGALNDTQTASIGAVGAGGSTGAAGGGAAAIGGAGAGANGGGGGTTGTTTTGDTSTSTSSQTTSFSSGRSSRSVSPAG